MRHLNICCCHWTWKRRIREWKLPEFIHRTGRFIPVLIFAEKRDIMQYLPKVIFRISFLRVFQSRLKIYHREDWEHIHLLFRCSSQVIRSVVTFIFVKTEWDEIAKYKPHRYNISWLNTILLCENLRNKIFTCTEMLVFESENIMWQELMWQSIQFILSCMILFSWASVGLEINY